MKILNELKIFNLYPDRLKKEVTNIRDFQIAEGVNKNLLEDLIEKLRKEEVLSNRNLKRLFYNSNLLNKRDVEILGQQIKNSLTPDRYKEFFEHFFENYVPEQAFNVIKEAKIGQFLVFLNPILIESINNYQNFEKYTSSIINQCENFGSFLHVLNVTENFMDSNGLIKVIEVTSRQKGFIEKYKNDAKSLISIVETLRSAEAKLDLVDTYFKTYISLFDDWAGGLLNDESFLSLFLNYIIHSRYEILPKYTYITKVLNVWAEVTEVINEMTKLEPKRGRYWKNKGKIYSDIITKHLTKDLLAVAFIIKDYAFVEFAKSGNAIYVYSKDDFKNKIQHKNDWKDKTLTIKNFLEYGSNGTLTHDIQGNWIDKLDSKFRKL